MYYQLLLKTGTGWTVRGSYESTAAGIVARLKSLLLTERPTAHLIAAENVTDLQCSIQAFVTDGTIPGVELPIDTDELDLRRFELEHGQGGDKNTPYFFELPWDNRIQKKRTKLFARVLRGDIGGPNDGANHTADVS